MHHALETEDLLVELFACCLESDLPNDNLQGRTLARLARCCSAFSEPALQLLWETVDLRNLLALFDPKLFTKHFHTGVIVRKSFACGISNSSDYHD
jgi:hypothetical protein